MTTTRTRQQLDLRGTPCPLNSVKTKLRLEQMAQGALLEVVVDDGAPARNVPRSVLAEGHKLVEVARLEDGVRLLIERC
ncbi:MAG: sulfurtransferase TusA family protein [Armatimonadota bacterium]